MSTSPAHVGNGPHAPATEDKPAMASASTREVSGCSSTPAGSIHVPDEEQAMPRPINPLQRSLKNRHIQMIAIGGAIGAGLFVGSGGALRLGGPGSVLIGYIVVGTMLQMMAQSLAEMAVMYPVNGSFYTYVCRFVDPSLGFAVGWMYAIVWLSALPFELAAASICIEYWRQDVSPAIFMTAILVGLICIQMLGVRGYGEVEFALGVVKVLACAGFVVLGVVIDCGGVGSRGYLGMRYWHDPGAFRNGLEGFAGVLVVASLSFGGTEMVGLAAAESTDPTRALPRASRQVFLRVALVYVLNLFVLGLVVSSADPRLLGAAGANTMASPFVLAIQDAGIRVLPSLFNGVILLAVLGVANASAFGSTRTMQALAARGMAPRFLAYVDPGGRPLWCIVTQMLFGTLAYIGVSSRAGIIFGWLLSISGIGFIVIWAGICLAHIRFRLAWAARGRSVDAIPSHAALGIYGSVIALVINLLVIAASIYSAFRPLHGSKLVVVDAIQKILTLPIFLLLYLFWKIAKRDWTLALPLKDVDLDTDLRVLTPAMDGPIQKKTWRNLPLRLLRLVF